MSDEEEGPPTAAEVAEALRTLIGLDLGTIRAEVDAAITREANR